MRFGFKTSPQHTTWQSMLDVWKAADDIDLYESGWNFDHFYPIFSDSTGPCLEGWSTLSALAQATRRIRIGVLVTGMPYRHPAVLANMAATVDIISGGRLELGLGAGWNHEEADAYGISLGATLTERFDRFDEGVEMIISLLSNEVTDFAGKHFTLSGARCEPKPIQRPHPPICIGGTGKRRTIPAAARFAQHWNHPGGSVEDWKVSRDLLWSECERIGRDPSEITTSIHLMADVADPGRTAEQAAAFADAGLDLGIVYIAPPHTPAALEIMASALSPLAD
ncbi:MAG: TIGR03560 family F420-dependent LLM class oxidoreductase [Actinobacteria bacterium]|nr:TIGR03560 family F420-dependent LLM class oxidoreductase [Actinomycetota bacterium]